MKPLLLSRRFFGRISIPSGQLVLQPRLDPYSVMLFEIFPVEVAQAERPREDINADGQVNVLDVVSLILRGNKNPADPRADYDGDGSWSVQDALSLAWDIINGGHGQVALQLRQNAGPHLTQISALK